ncbi:hypothetical protein ACI2I2_16700 [Scandinavium sp. NPDC088450]|uniref:hypothetical protein n=1 Tax=Scandinavium sp. NPDC088450 TaxID=3364514 RepID=UPI00385100D1
MIYTHVLIKMKSDGKNKPVVYAEADLDEAFVVEHVIKPYVNGERIFVDGARANADDIEKISVYASEAESSVLLEEENARNKGVSAREKANRIFSGNVGRASLLSVVQNAGQNITRQVFNEALGITQ